MKQQYTVLMNDEHNKLIIREYGELDKDMLSLLCEETYDDAEVRTAIAGGKEKVISAIRTKNLYPPRGHAEKLTGLVMDYYASGQYEPMHLAIDEPAASSKEILVGGDFLDIEGEEEIIDDLLEDDFDTDSDDSDEIKIDSSIKIADDDVVDVEDDL